MHNKRKSQNYNEGFKKILNAFNRLACSWVQSLNVLKMVTLNAYVNSIRSHRKQK